jgi:hypothetical protein
MSGAVPDDPVNTLAMVQTNEITWRPDPPYRREDDNSVDLYALDLTALFTWALGAQGDLRWLRLAYHEAVRMITDLTKKVTRLNDTVRRLLEENRRLEEENRRFRGQS